FRNQTIANQVFRFEIAQGFADVLPVVLALDLGAEADAALLRAVADDLVQTRKSTTTDKQNVACVHLQKFLLRMLAPALGRNRRNGAFDQFQKSLLHTFTRY